MRVLGLEFPVLYDTDGAVARSWGVYNLLGDGVATPATYVYDATGALRAFRIGKDAADRPGPAEVLEVIQSFAREGVAAAPGASGTPVAVMLGEGAEFGACAVPEAGATGTPAASSCDNPPPRASVTPAPTETAVAPSLAPAPPPTASTSAVTAATPSPSPAATPVPLPSATASARPPPSATAAATPSPVAKALALGPGLSDFTLPDARGGGSVQLSSYLGKRNVVLVFYRAYW